MRLNDKIGRSKVMKGEEDHETLKRWLSLPYLNHNQLPWCASQ